LTYVRLALVLDVAAFSVGFTLGSGSAVVRVQAAGLAVFLYACLAWWSASHTRRVAVAVLVLSVIGATANLVSPDAASLVVAVLSVASGALAVAALRHR
jgi:hypothetical protein